MMLSTTVKEEVAGIENNMTVSLAYRGRQGRESRVRNLFVFML